MARRDRSGTRTSPAGFGSHHLAADVRDDVAAAVAGDAVDAGDAGPV